MTDPSQPSSNSEHQQEQFDHDNRKSILNNPKYVVVSLVTLLAVVLMTVSLILLMRNTTHPADERAWVKVQEATIVGPLVQHNVPQATVFFNNTGSSPALKTKIRLVMTVWPSNKLPDWEMPLKLATDSESIGEIDPGSIVSRTVSLLAPLTDEQGMYLERKDWFIVTLGVVSYVDTFGNRRETKLCLIWRDTSIERLSPCEKWNNAD
ncbi:MAG: hypothetical protein NDI90_10445 [Nitrospira sp. BO4]|jgi:hypothetical protein|nr:hypothetical protein [Nitrospira sp. BO4]